MNWCVPAALFAVIALSISDPSVAQAQDASSFEQLQKAVQPGDTLLVTDKSGKVVKGKAEQVSGTSLSLKTGGRRLDFAEADIVEIKKQRGDSLANGALIGALAVGAPVLVLAAATSDPNDICCSGADAALVGAAFAGAGAGVGALVDALHKHRETVYSRAKNQTARFYVGPMITSSRKGVQFAIRF